MKKSLCVIAAVLMVLGAALILTAFRRVDFDLDKLNGAVYASDGGTVGGEIDAVNVVLIDADLRFIEAKAGEAEISVYTTTKTPVTWNLKDGLLMIRQTDERKWFEKIGIFSTRQETVTIALPEKAYTFLIAGTVNGEIVLDRSSSFSVLKTKTVNGKIELRGRADDIQAVTVNGGISSSIAFGTARDRIENPARFSAETVNGYIIESTMAMENELETTNGEIHISGMNPEAVYTVKTTNGRVKMDNLYAAEVRIETTNGDVTGTIQKGMDYRVTTTNGVVSVPEETGENPFIVKTVNGDVRITIGK